MAAILEVNKVSKWAVDAIKSQNLLWLTLIEITQAREEKTNDRTLLLLDLHCANL